MFKRLTQTGVMLALWLLARMPAASADVLTFRFTGSGSGTLAGEVFPTSSFVITARADTNNRQAGAHVWTIPHTSASIWIAGLGDFEFLSQTRTFVNNNIQIVGFSRAGAAWSDLFDGPYNSAFAVWDMLAPIGPFTGTGWRMQWSDSPQINTSGGILIFDDGSCGATFAAIPEPGTLALCSAMTLMVRRRR